MQNWIFEIRSTKFFLLLLLFAVIASLVAGHITTKMDNAAEVFSHSLSGNRILDYGMETLSEIGGIFNMAIFCIALFIKKSTRRLGLVLILGMLVGTIASAYLKFAIHEDRQHLDFTGTPFPIRLEPDTFASGALSSSFPSGHATRTAVFAFVLGFALSKRFPRGCYLMWLYPILVSISRVYMLEHFPMDVIGGVVLGIIIATVVSKKLKLELIFERSKPK